MDFNTFELHPILKTKTLPWTPDIPTWPVEFHLSLVQAGCPGSYISQTEVAHEAADGVACWLDWSESEAGTGNPAW